MTESWTLTNQIRWHKHVTHYEWSTKYDEVYTLTLEQLWVSSEGVEEWREVPTFKTKDPNAISYG